MRVKVTKLMDGPGPNEVLVKVETDQGHFEEVIVHSAAIESDTIDIGYPLHSENDRAFVELPRETMSGSWRIWVPMANVT